MKEQNQIKQGKATLKDSTGVKIDMVQLNNITLKDIRDLDFLFQMGIAKYDLATQNQIKLASGEEFTSIQIQNERHGIRNFSCHLGLNWKNELAPYCSLQLIVDEPNFRNLNCRSFSEFQSTLIDVETFLQEFYGIYISFDDAIFHTIEINKTFSFPWNHDVLELLINLIPKGKRMPYRPPFNVVQDTGVNTNIDVFSFVAYSKEFKKGKGIQAKFYDKSRQLQHEYDIVVDDHYLRFELTVSNAKKICQIFGTNKLKEFSQDIITDTFHNFIEKCFAQTYKNFCKDRQKLLKKIFTEEFKKTPRSTTWIHDAILRILDIEKKKHFHQILQDVQEIFEIWNKIPFVNSYQKANYKKKLKNICKEEFPCLLTNTDAETSRLIELLSKKENQ